MSDQQPAEKELPSEEELKQLSYRGMVCYAVRCAKRVAILTEHYPELRKKSEACINAATSYCKARYDADFRDAADAARAAIDIRYGTANITRDATASVAAANLAARATLSAATAIDNANRAAPTGIGSDATIQDALSAAADEIATDATDAAARAANAAAYAVGAATSAHVENTVAFDDAIYAAAISAAKADLKKLRKLPGHQVVKTVFVGNPIDPSEASEELGKLWPDAVRQKLLDAIECKKPRDS